MLKYFLKYVNGPKDENNFINMINNKISKIKDNKEWWQEYMTLLMREQEKFEQGIQQSKQEEKHSGMLKQISVLKELNIDNSIIIEKVSRDYEVLEEEIKNIYKLRKFKATTYN